MKNPFDELIKDLEEAREHPIADKVYNLDKVKLEGFGDGFRAGINIAIEKTIIQKRKRVRDHRDGN